MSKVRLGLIGASRIADKILPQIKSVPNLDILGVASKTLTKAQALTHTHQLPRAYSSYEECLADPNINAVYISVLNADHTNLIKQSLLAGKHVLCEKPLVLTAQDAKELFELADGRGLLLIEGFMYRFHPQIRAMKEIVKNRTFGELRSISVDFSFCVHDFQNPGARVTAAAGGGALNDVGCYGIDFILSIGGLIDTELSEWTVTGRRNSEIDLETRAQMKFRNGVVAQLTCAVDQPSSNLWEIKCSRGSIGALRFDPHGAAGQEIWTINDESERSIINVGAGQQFFDEFSSFVDSILHGVKPFITPNESIKTAELLERLQPQKKTTKE